MPDPSLSKQKKKKTSNGSDPNPSAKSALDPTGPKPLSTPVVSLGLLITISALGASIAFGKPIYWGLVTGYLIFLGLALHAGYSLGPLVQTSLGSIYKVKTVLMMLALVGMIIPLWMQTGVLATLMAYSIDAFARFNLAVAAYLSSVAVSMILGSGIGTTSTVGLVFIAIARSIGLNEAMIVGAVVSGAYTGDRTSLMSSNFNLVSEITGTDLKGNFVYMLSSTLPVFIMTTISYGFLGPSASDSQAQSLDALRQLLGQSFEISPAQLIPPAVMLFFVLVLRQNMVVSLGAALVLSIGSGLMGGGIEWMPLLTGLEGNGPLGALFSGSGLTSMMGALLLIAIASALSGLFQMIRCLEPLLDRASRKLATRGHLIFSTGMVSLLVSLVSGNQTMTTLITGNYFKEKYDAFKIDRRLLARTISDTGVVCVPLIPWNINGILVATVTGVSTAAYLPYALSSWLLPAITLYFAARGLHKTIRLGAPEATMFQQIASSALPIGDHRHNERSK